MEPICSGCMVSLSTRKDGFCSTTCFNRCTKRKPVDGYKPCLECGALFPFRLSLRVRSSGSIGYATQTYCSRQCSLRHRNRTNNPASTPEGRRKIAASALVRNNDHLRSPEARANQSKAISGSNHWNWQGGITSENRRRRNLRESRQWRVEIFKRDNYTCQLCGARSGNGHTVKLNADHIKPWSLYPELRNELSNGRTLCVPCHRNTDTYMGRIKRYKCG